VVAPSVHPALADLAAQGRITVEQRRFCDEDVIGHALVFAATDDARVNERVAAQARLAGLWVNVADDAARSTFHLPARVRRGARELAVSTGGTAPFAARRLSPAG
jgi:siroheme synthase-like protein